MHDEMKIYIGLLTKGINCLIDSNLTTRIRFCLFPIKGPQGANNLIQ